MEINEFYIEVNGVNYKVYYRKISDSLYYGKQKDFDICEIADNLDDLKQRLKEVIELLLMSQEKVE